MPKRTFTDKMTIGNGADRVELYYFGRGHTNGDAWVFVYNEQRDTALTNRAFIVKINRLFRL
jgi:hypothetical protein